MSVVQSRIDTVKIHHRGATVYRAIDLPANGAFPEEIEIPKLPLSLVDPTVRLRVESFEGSASDLIASGLRIGLYVDPRERIEDAPDREKLRAVSRAIALKRQALEQVRMETVLLSGIEVPARPAGEEGRAPPASPMAARVALEEFVEESMRARTEEGRALSDELETLEEEKRELEERIARASNARTAKTEEISKTVIARLLPQGGQVTSARLVLEYFVPGARWAPAYQCRLTRDCKSAEIQLRALIAQRTGEDWRGVKLVLSTAAPMRWTEIPELAAIRIGRAQPPPPVRRGFRPPPVGAAALFADFDHGYDRALAALPRKDEWSAAALELRAPLLPGAERSLATPPARTEMVLASVPRSAGAPRPPPAPQARLASKAARVRATDTAGAIAPRGAWDPPTSPALEGPTDEDVTREALLGAANLEASSIAEGEEPVTRASELEDRYQLSPAPKVDRATGAAGAPSAPGRELLEIFAYDQLRLGSSREPGRARLRPVDRDELYLETLRRAAEAVGPEVLRAVDQAALAASAVEAQALPPGAVDVRSATACFDFAYAADQPVDVASDALFHSVALGTRTAAADVRYVVVPREDNHVYRIAMVTNPTDAPLLPGPAELYVGGEYVLTTELPVVPGKGELHIGLGVEQSIKCARNTRFVEKRSGSQIVATNELWHDIEIELANNLEREIACEVRERIPQPAPGAEVVVDEGDVAPAWEEYTQAERGGTPIIGGRRWRVTVPAGQKHTLRAQYVVKIYANNEVVGGNRREA